MPIQRIDKARARRLRTRVKKVADKKGGVISLVRGAQVWNRVVYNAIDGKCLNVSNAEKLEKFLDESGIKPLTETYKNADNDERTKN